MLMMVVLIPRPFKTTGSRLAEVSVRWLTAVYPTVLFNEFRLPCEVVQYCFFQLEADFRPPAMAFIYLFRWQLPCCMLGGGGGGGWTYFLGTAPPRWWDDLRSEWT